MRCRSFILFFRHPTFVRHIAVDLFSQANTQKLAKQTTQWLQLISQFNTALKVRAI